MTYGFIDEKGNVIIEPIFDFAESFSCGLASVTEKNEALYIYKDGNRLNTIQLTKAEMFKEGLSFGECQEGGVVINLKGEIVLEHKFEEWSFFSNGMARVKNNGLYGYINSEGKEIIPTTFVAASDFSEGMALVTDKAGRSYYINLNGKELYIDISDDLEFHGVFNEGLAVVYSKINNKFGFINAIGELTIPCSYSEASGFLNGMAIVANDKGMYGVINKNCEVKVELNYEGISKETGGPSNFGAVKCSGSWYIFDNKNRQILKEEGEYQFLGSQNNGLILTVSIEGDNRYLSTDNLDICISEKPHQYYFSDFSEGFCRFILK